MVTLSDYLGYIFIEITRARQMADQFSVNLAEEHSKDPLLKYISVPRFKIPEMEINVPVLVSGAKFSQVLKFNDGSEEFRKSIQNELNNAFRKYLLKKNNLVNTITTVNKIDFSNIFRTTNTNLINLRAYKCPTVSLMTNNWVNTICTNTNI